MFYLQMTTPDTEGVWNQICNMKGGVIIGCKGLIALCCCLVCTMVSQTYVWNHNFYITGGLLWILCTVYKLEKATLLFFKVAGYDIKWFRTYYHIYSVHTIYIYICNAYVYDLSRIIIWYLEAMIDEQSMHAPVVLRSSEFIPTMPLSPPHSPLQHKSLSDYFFLTTCSSEVPKKVYLWKSRTHSSWVEQVLRYVVSHQYR